MYDIIDTNNDLVDHPPENRRRQLDSYTYYETTCCFNFCTYTIIILGIYQIPTYIHILYGCVYILRIILYIYICHNLTFIHGFLTLNVERSRCASLNSPLSSSTNPICLLILVTARPATLHLTGQANSAATIHTYIYTYMYIPIYTFI